MYKEIQKEKSEIKGKPPPSINDESSYYGK